VREDFGDLAAWLADPEVARWWREDADPISVEARYGPAVDGQDPTRLVVVEVDGVPSGLVQGYRIADDPDWHQTLAGACVDVDLDRMAGMDYLLGRPDVRGRGLGTKVVEAFSTGLLAEAGIDGVLVDVLQANRPSWRALERAGFERVWAGRLVTDDPSDDGPAYLYLRGRR